MSNAGAFGERSQIQSRGKGGGGACEWYFVPTAKGGGGGGGGEWHFAHYQWLTKVRHTFYICERIGNGNLKV